MSKSETEVKQNSPDPLACRVCGGKEWNYGITRQVVIFLAESIVERSTLQSMEELRCATCDRKATLVNNEAIRALPVFNKAKDILR